MSKLVGATARILQSILVSVLRATSTKVAVFVFLFSVVPDFEQAVKAAIFFELWRLLWEFGRK
jgi:hypothetical protein